jgi:hypothetical protein
MDMTTKPTGGGTRARCHTDILRRENSAQRGGFLPKRLYKLRAIIKPTIGKLERLKRVATRSKKRHQLLSDDQFCMRADAG